MLLASDEEVLKHLHSGRPILDVRAPVEFQLGAIPGSFNIPLLNDEQRTIVGTVYKNEGADAALKLGYRLISGEVFEERVATWQAFLEKNPTTAVMCFRGGQRSQLVQAALLRNGFDQQLIQGGFKRVRRLLAGQLERACEVRPWRVLSGYTGTGKTRILRTSTLPFLDLEHAARHRGSSFGPWTVPQPTPVTFENELGLEASRLLEKTESNEPIWLEDESRSIGKRVLPAKLFQTMSISKVWILERPIGERVENLTFEYLSVNYGLVDGVVPNPELFLRVGQDICRAVINIERRLGGAETQNVLSMIKDALKEFGDHGAFSAHWPWVERVLKTYYDPLYEKHLAFISDRVVGRGPEESFFAIEHR